MDHNKAIYLRLSPEFGEHRFGPYENLEVRVGSDRQNCAICIENFGALPIHCKLLIQGEKDLIIVPSERSAEVFLWRKNKVPEQIFGATAVVPGDAFSIIMANGPKFIIEWDELPEEVKIAREKAASRGGVGRNRLSKKSMGAEVKRQAFTQLLVMGPMQLLQRAVIFVKSGAIYQPRNIIAGFVLLSGWMIGGSMSCRSRKLSATNTTITKERDDCKRTTKHLESIIDDKDFSLDQAILGVTKSEQLGLLLRKDSKLLDLVKSESETLMNKKPPKWLIKTNHPYAKRVKNWMIAVNSFDDTEIDLETKKLLMWNISKKGTSNANFVLTQDPKKKDQCGRGIMQLSFQQAVHLGLDAQPDAFFEENATNLTRESKIAQLKGTITKTLGSEEFSEEAKELIEALEDKELETEQLDNSTLQSCIYAGEEDDRMKDKEMLRKLKRMIGVGADDLPNEEDMLSSASRLAKIYTADVKGVDFRKEQDRIEFSGTLSASVDDLDDQGDWVLEKTAETIARSIVLPCYVVLEGTDEAKELIAAGDPNSLPDPVSCLVFNWRVRKNE